MTEDITCTAPTGSIAGISKQLCENIVHGFMPSSKCRILAPRQDDSVRACAAPHGTCWQLHPGHPSSAVPAPGCAPPAHRVPLVPMMAQPICQHAKSQRHAFSCCRAGQPHARAYTCRPVLNPQRQQASSNVECQDPAEGSTCALARLKSTAALQARTERR